VNVFRFTSMLGIFNSKYIAIHMLMCT